MKFSSDIHIVHPCDMIFLYEGKEYYLDLSASELKIEIAADMPMVEDDVIDSSVYIGSPYRTITRRAKSSDVTIEQIKQWIVDHSNQWRQNQ